MDMKGNYRFYFISDGRDYAKTDDSESNHNSNFGWALSFDHFVAENIGLFLRYGKQKDDLTANTVTSAWSTGVSVNGNIWRRSDDFAGLGYGVVKKNDTIETTFSGKQNVVELFYHFKLWDNLSVTPNIQVHKNLPRADNRDIMVYGFRLQLDFF